MKALSTLFFAATAALALDAEKQALNEKPTPSEKPALNDILDARTRYESALGEATDRYVAELEKIKSHAISEKDFKTAKAADAQINATLSTHLIDKWVLTGPIFGKNKLVIRIASDQTCVREDGTDSGKWVIENGFLVMSWRNGWKNRIPVLPRTNSIGGESQAPGSNDWAGANITFTKVK